MTPAEELRQAAATIRERAEAAAPGPWSVTVKSYGSDGGPYEGAEIPGVAEEAWCAEEGPRPPLDPPDATHIATWSPPVALAVAAWLESAADHRDSRYDLGDSCDDCDHDALTVARLINGGRS